MGRRQDGQPQGTGRPWDFGKDAPSCSYEAVLVTALPPLALYQQVPVSAPAGAAGAERARRLEAEAEASPYSTVQHQDLAAAAADAAARAAAKPPLAQPRDAEGQG